MVTPIDEDLAATAMSLLLAGIGLVVLDGRVHRVDVLSDPVGFAIAFEGARRLRRSTAATPWSLLLVTLAPIAIATSAAVEVGGFLYGQSTGLTASAGVPVESPRWIAVTSTATVTLTTVGVLLLARHLRGVLDGIASDRWRQVTISWVVFVVLGGAAWATAAIELIALAAAVGLAAAALLLLSLLATRRLLEEGAAGGARPGPDAFD